MLVLLKLEYFQILLPNERGLQSILTALAKAKHVKRDNRFNSGGMDIEPLTVEVEMLPDYVLTTRRKSSAVEPDEVISPIVDELMRGTSFPSPRNLTAGQFDRSMKRLGVGRALDDFRS